MPQRADGGRTVKDNHGAESLRQCHHVGVAQVGAKLRQIGALERARVQIDERIAGLNHVGEE